MKSRSEVAVQVVLGVLGVLLICFSIMIGTPFVLVAEEAGLPPAMEEESNEGVITYDEETAEFVLGLNGTIYMDEGEIDAGWKTAFDLNYDVIIHAEEFFPGKEVILIYAGKELHINLDKLIETDDIRVSIYEREKEEQP